MTGETRITVIGNLTADPEIRYTQGSNLPVANLTIASTPRQFDRQTNDWKDGDTLFLRSSAWRDLAENIGNTLTRGMRVIASGILKQRSYTDKEGNDRTVVEFEIEEIGPSLRYATAEIHRAGGDQRTLQREQPRQTQPARRPTNAPQQPAPSDGDWYPGDETPF